MQNYQVFINEHLLLLVEDTKKINSSKWDRVMEEPNKKDIEKIVYDLLLKASAERLLFLFSNLSKGWEKFKSQFHYLKAAGGLVFNRKEEVLFIYRLGKWDLPKGKVEVGESIESAALREVEEECGISNLSILEEIESTFHIYKQGAQLILKRTYWFKMKYSGNETLVPQGEEAIEKAVWIDPDNSEQQFKNTYASLKGILDSLKEGT